MKRPVKKQKVQDDYYGVLDAIHDDDTARFLFYLSKGVDVNMREPNGGSSDSFLTDAVVWRRNEIIDILLERGAVFTDTDIDILFPYSLSYPRVMGMILEDDRYNKGNVARDTATGLNIGNHLHPDSLKLVLKHMNINDTIKERVGQTLLFYANTPTILNLLLDSGADINHQDYNQGTPIMALIEGEEVSKDWLSMLDIFLKRGALIDIVDSHNKTPVHMITELLFKELADDQYEEDKNRRLGPIVLKAYKMIGQHLVNTYSIKPYCPKNNREQDDSGKECYTDPITQECLDDKMLTVTGPSGYCFDKNELQTWIYKGNYTDPMSRAKLTDRWLLEWKMRKPGDESD